MAMYCSTIATGHVSFPVLPITTSFPSLYWSVLLSRTLILTSVLENHKSEHCICAVLLKRKNPEKARRQIVIVCISNNDADSWTHILTIFCSNCRESGDAGSFFQLWPPFYAMCTLIPAYFSLLGEINLCAHASAITGSSTAVFASEVSSKSCRWSATWQVELGTLIFRGNELPTSSNDQKSGCISVQ